ncbi:hypothetical protein [uncultured Vagococcus sp.]|uniref:hypothetical protein n=1 Tax=uncultured Vagococcus sp. TaxID=189676 RepID=UPI00258E10AE|nr:hypothetical protein [uncultured Vagococcus sp.]
MDTNLVEFLADLTILAVVIAFVITVILGIFFFFKFLVGLKLAVILLTFMAILLVCSAFLKGSSKNSKQK